MQQLKFKINAEIISNRAGLCFAVMETKRLGGPDRWSYVMDQSGQYELLHERYIYKYKGLGLAQCMDANLIKQLLIQLNYSVFSGLTTKGYIWNFNKLYDHD